MRMLAKRCRRCRQSWCCARPSIAALEVVDAALLGQEFHCQINILPFHVRNIFNPVGIYVPAGLVRGMNRVSLKVLDEPAATVADGSPLGG
jgi:hypothetical protein